jgi:cell division protein FtsZ
MKEMIKFDMPKNQSSIIKVIGVGGGGSNAVNHMYRQGIKGVDFLICNTDAQAMESSPVPVKIQLGEKGLGAGSVPAVGKESARQKIDQIKEILEKNTQMVFITAGMGGGTGTGAAPVIAQTAKELGILTVGIVTIPFTFEGKRRKQQADEGILELKKYVDTLLIICNDKLREQYGDLKLSEAFNKADDVLTTAAKGIAEIITVTGYINVDFEDVKTVMQDSGKAIMGHAKAEGENRAIEAVKNALASPLLNDNEIEGASNVLLYITSGQEEISMDEVTEITDYIQKEAKSQAEIIWGNGYDESLGNNISITLIATGFDAEKKTQQDNVKKYNLSDNPAEIDSLRQPPAAENQAVSLDRISLIQKTVHEDQPQEQTVDHAPSSEPDHFGMLRKPSLSEAPSNEDKPQNEEWKESDRTFVFELSQEPVEDTADEPEPDTVEMADVQPATPEATIPGGNGGHSFHDDDPKETEVLKPFEVYIRKPQAEAVEESPKTSGRPAIDLKSQERIDRLRSLSAKLRNEQAIEALENEPAYMRRNVELTNNHPSSENRISRYSLYNDGDGKNPEIRTGNSFLHDNVD